MHARFAVAALGLALAAMTPACAAEQHDAADEGSQEDDLTSLTARERTLTFDGYVFVSANASDGEILNAVRRETKSAFGALREADIGVNTRELGVSDASGFQREKVEVVDPATGAVLKSALRVRYRYTDRAVVPTTLAKRTSVSLGLLHGDYQAQSSRVLKECTGNTSHDREFEGSIWYVFNPGLSSCKTAMTTEQIDIDAARKGLKSPSTQVVPAELSRLYVPMTAKLESKAMTSGTAYPEYDRLWSGGVQPGKLVVGMVHGMMADWAAGEKHDTIDDDGYRMFFEGLREIMKVHPKLALVKSEPAVDLSTFTVGGKTIAGVSFNDIVKWELDGTGFPTGVTSSADKRALRVAAGDKIARHWLTFEVPVQVAIGAAPARTITIQLNSYFGAETSSAPHRRAMKNSDVFIYNGHSYIGYGPLDPSNFSAADFPSSYQLMFVNGCVSFNYYEKDYFPLKQGGTQNLDLVTNGLESWVNGSGPAMGRFVARLTDGTQASYKELLKAAQFTSYGYDWGMDALRVVDGEADNKYKPSKTPIKVTRLRTQEAWLSSPRRTLASSFRPFVPPDGGPFVFVHGARRSPRGSAEEWATFQTA